MSERGFADRIETIREFNRFYTQRIGVLADSYLHSPFSLSQARILYELAHRDSPTAGELARNLSLDPGYLSRMLRELEQGGLLAKRRSPRDGRQRLLALTARGREVFAPLEAASRAQVGQMLGDLSDGKQRQLVAAMRDVRGLLGDRPDPAVPFLLRSHQPGDMGWVVQRHALLYAQEYGWGGRFEGLVAEIVAAFIRDEDPVWERCWIAERDGENVGSAFLVKHPERERVARLRLLLVEPSARGLGLGRRLVEECIRFARRTGYHTITLWTNSVLVSARRIYETAGFCLTDEGPHHSFGHDLIGQTWELALAGGLQVMGDR